MTLKHKPRSFIIMDDYQLIIVCVTILFEKLQNAQIFKKNEKSKSGSKARKG